MDKRQKYTKLMAAIQSLLGNEKDTIAMMATIACELKKFSESFSWTGFYRVVGPELLKVGPYQGPHGCMEISFDRGVCGKCALEQKTQIVQDVSKIPYHIACSGETKSEIVVPVFDAKGVLLAVLDIDSNLAGCFDETDRKCLEEICAIFEKL
jgi:GAF domain-containing protein